MNYAQIDEQEIKDSKRNQRKSSKRNQRKSAKVVEEEWREELKKKNSIVTQKIKKSNERRRLQCKSRVNVVVESENK